MHTLKTVQIPRETRSAFPQEFCLSEVKFLRDFGYHRKRRKQPNGLRRGTEVAARVIPNVSPIENLAET